MSKPAGMLFEMAAATLKNATVSTVGASAVAAAEIEFSPAAGKAVGTLFQTFFSRKKYVERANNLKQIGLAIHNYHDVNAHLPTNITNAKGEAILRSARLFPSLSRTGQSLQAVQAG